LFSPPWKLNRETVKQDFRDVLYDADADPNMIRQELAAIDRDYFIQVLSLRDDFPAAGIEELADHLDTIRMDVLNSVQTAETPKPTIDMRQQVEDYLRSTDKANLNPDAIARDFDRLLADPEAEFESLGNRLSEFDRGTLEQLLSQRQDIDAEESSQIITHLEATRDRVLSKAQALQGRLQGQAQELRQKVSDYLRDTKAEELNPEGIQRDLKMLFEDPEAGASALSSRLSQFDRETLVKLLSQRDDLSEEQVNQTIDQMQSAMRSLIKAPRRLANRVKQQAADFESNLESYLQNTTKEELNPEGIKRDLQLLLNDPRSGLASLGDRASQFDRGTFVALLAQRKDITEAEANHIADQLESNFKAVVDQVQQVKQAVQSTIDKGFESVRNYLNDLERPELNYDGIKQDFGKLFDDPKLGLEALRDRLTQFDRDTLIALLSSREDISEADANRIIGQVESARDGVLHQVERVQEETQKRLEAIKHATQKQVRETRKVAASAAWWVFSSALFSLVASATAGFLAVTRLMIV
jgi:hypothetical protein